MRRGAAWARFRWALYPHFTGGRGGAWSVDAVLSCVFLFSARDVAVLEQTTVFLSLRVLLPFLCHRLACLQHHNNALAAMVQQYRLLRHDKRGGDEERNVDPSLGLDAQQHGCNVHRTILRYNIQL